MGNCIPSSPKGYTEQKKPIYESPIYKYKPPCYQYGNFKPIYQKTKTLI